MCAGPHTGRLKTARGGPTWSAAPSAALARQTAKAQGLAAVRAPGAKDPWLPVRPLKGAQDAYTLRKPALAGVTGRAGSLAPPGRPRRAPAPCRPERSEDFSALLRAKVGKDEIPRYARNDNVTVAAPGPPLRRAHLALCSQQRSLPPTDPGVPAEPRGRPRRRPGDPGGRDRARRRARSGAGLGRSGALAGVTGRRGLAWLPGTGEPARAAAAGPAPCRPERSEGRRSAPAGTRLAGFCGQQHEDEVPQSADLLRDDNG